MKKKKTGRKFGRMKDQRKALLVSLARSLFLKEKIRTSMAKAKELSSFAEKFITKAKTNNLASRRALARLFSASITKKILEDIAPRYKDRKGGYTRVVKLGRRQTDGAELAIISLVK